MASDMFDKVTKEVAKIKPSVSPNKFDTMLMKNIK